MKKITVHIADDHQLLIDGLVAVLSSEENITIVGTSLNGEEVVNWFDSNLADILILDINMPKLDGIAVLKSFRDRGFQQKVIVLSSYDDSKLIKEVLKIGASGFLAKKCAGESIVDSINQVFLGKQYFSESIKDKLLLSFSKKTSNFEEVSQDGFFLNTLTPRETDVLKLICKQMNSNEISSNLHISVNTVETHRKNMINKLQVKNVVGLAIYAVKHNIV
ncbi:response regulator [Lutibacter citreus]|uniref:response regulator n=1 Tax=Lutibacter citreus TaxID=2138210 RepID=UPI000DBE38A5|nr:response regulator transcription factor [Lutibacter citreus]